MAGKRKKNGAEGKVERSAEQAYAENIAEARGLIQCLLAKMARHEARFGEADGKERVGMVADASVWRGMIERTLREG